MDGINRRGETRVEWRGSVQLVVKGFEPMTASIADISEFGCGLQVERAIAPGTTVGIEGDTFEASGSIRYCYPHQGGFRLGVELHPVS